MSKRGKNFTELEKTLLLSIIDKYKTIIENKCTNAISVKKKQEQWDIITNKFNSASDYPRSLKQLQVAYSNLKRTTRKDVADKNKENYLKTKASTSNVIIETLDIVDIEKDTREEFNNIYLKFKKDEAEDKKAIKATGGGSYQPKLSESGARVLAIMGDQVKPLDNTCDSATDYFYNEEKSETVQKVCKAVHSNMDDFNEIIIDNGNSLDLDDTEENVHNEYAGSPPRDIEIETHKSLTAGPEHETHQSKRTRVEANDTSILKARENYYRKKLEAAVIEKRTRLIEEKIALKKLELAKLEVELKKKEIEKM